MAFFEEGKKYTHKTSWSIIFQASGVEKVEVLQVVTNSRGFQYAFVHLTMDGRTEDRFDVLDEWEFDNLNYKEVVPEPEPSRCSCCCKQCEDE